MANLDDQYDIDERYRAFEDHEFGILVSLAGPGTGKTFSILKRINTLINTRRISGNHICYLTFIRDIADAFKSDFNEEFGDDPDFEDLPRISTLHSLACRLIRNRGFSIGFDGELYFTSIAPKPDTFESRIFLSDLIGVINHNQLNTISRIRNSLIPIKEAWRNTIAPESLGGLESIAFEGYLELARSYRLIDWDHTIPIANDLYDIEENRQRWLTQIDHLLIDEYQDFNQSEQQFISELVSNISSAVIVGDDDQSLFSGRGGSPVGIRNLFVSADANQVSLTKCRRCGSNILDHANTFLRTMKPHPREMLPHNEGGVIQSLRFKSSKAEIEFLVDFLSKFRDRLPDEPRPRYGAICLFPTKKSLGFYFEAISQYIPCYTSKLDINQTRIHLIHALCLCARPYQRFAERLLLDNFQEIKPRHRKYMVSLIIERDVSPVDACQIMIDEGIFSGASESEAEMFVATCQSLSLRNTQEIANLISGWTEIGIEQLESMLDQFLSNLDDHEQETSISDFCDLALPSTAMPPVDPKAIPFITMHGAKGLTKNTVIIPGFEDAWLPGSSTGSSFEEKQRLFYVALTRATDHILITHPANRNRGDPLNYTTEGRSVVSRFTTDSGIITQYQP